MSMFFNMLAGGLMVDEPIYGSKGVFIASSNTILSSGMSMFATVIGSGQAQYVWNKGVVSSGLVESHGELVVYSGGTISDVTHIGAGWGASPTIISSGGYAYNLSLYNNVNQNWRGLYNYGTISGLLFPVMNGQPITAYIYDGDVSDVTMSTRCYMHVSGGRVSGVTMSTDCYMYVSGGRVSGINQSNSPLEIYSGASVFNVYSGMGNVNIHEGGYLSGLTKTQSGGQIMVYPGAVVCDVQILVSGYSKFFVSSATISGGLGSNYRPYFSSSIIYDYTQSDGAIDGRNTPNSFIRLSTFNVAYESFTGAHITDWTLVRLKSGGASPTFTAISASNFNFSMTVSGTYLMTLQSGTILDGGYIRDGMRVSAVSSFIKNTTIERTNPSNADPILDLRLGLSDSLNASNIFICSGGSCVFSSGASGAAFTIGDGGRMTIKGYALCDGIVVNSGGSLNVDGGGGTSAPCSALNVTSNPGAIITVSNGGYIEYTD